MSSLLLLLLFDDSEDFVFPDHEKFLILDLEFRAGVLADEDAVSLFDVERELLSVIVDFALADGDDFRVHRLFLGGVGDDDPPLARFPVLDALDEDPVVERTNLHGNSSCSVLQIAPDRPKTGDLAILALLVVEC
jgi:hypothetical protein